MSRGKIKCDEVSGLWDRNQKSHLLMAFSGLNSVKIGVKRYMGSWPRSRYAYSLFLMALYRTGLKNRRFSSRQVMV